MIAAVLTAGSSAVELGQEWTHHRKIPHRPDRKSVREQVTERYDRREEIWTQTLEHRQSSLDDHVSGRKLLSDEELNQHRRQIQGIKRKLAVAKHADASTREFDIEHDIEMHQRMMEGDFIWTHEGLVLKDPK